MTSASLELSKELYELSGWKDTDNKYGNRGSRPSLAQMTLAVPAYDLGYLLRKLPMSKSPHSTSTLTIFGTSYGEWKACYAASQQSFAADTPEDAVCKLAIELFKQGVLK